MHHRDLAELAALLAIHAPAIVQRRQPLPAGSSQAYWAASKCRFDRWGRVLRQLTAAESDVHLPPTVSWPRVAPVLEEILVSELLTRVWTATAIACDAALREQELEPVARSVFTSHLDARRRVLTLIAEGRILALGQIIELNRLRRRLERWTDMLLSHFTDLIDTVEFTFEPGRARDFADDLDRDSVGENQQFTSQLMLVSVRASFADGLAERAANPDLNRRIGSAVLDLFGDQMSESVGSAKPLWLERINRTATDAQQMIDELVRLDLGLLADAP
jgi:hypothetical protein